MAWFGTNDFREIAAKAEADPEGRESLFLNGYCLSVAKYIASLSADVCGKVDAVRYAALVTQHGRGASGQSAMGKPGTHHVFDTQFLT